ncbi:secretion/DNA translocation related TadE-like protein [Brevibacterium sanguinis]|uniref:Secretion/DNA translocation related TadE-like protein n=2 Tax=Brevibacterium TaxID=1696 RepID=A0A366IH62_9MICO|nr:MULTISPECIES: Rv3654c family TadE-like protein [Brevibacterium]RBP63387.1 secretion/DNA translocation related TadE-like protein [Brevibacterium sanguinis]RBP69854.1 secretion/DNA translocation related TadE-like protein [Brevibacterium celere]
MTTIVTGVCALILVVVTALGGLTQAFVAHSSAQSAADLAALAAADVVRGLAPGDACEAAREVAQRNGATMRDCLASTSEQSAFVEVEVEIPGPLPGVREKAVAGR